MPLYTYECTKHGKFDAMNKISERQLAKCPKCDEHCYQAVTAPRSINGGYYDKVAKVR